MGRPVYVGAQYLDLTDADDTGVSGGVTQNIATVAGNTYLLTHWLGTTTLSTSESVIRATAGSTTADCTAGAPTSNATWTQCSMAFTATGSSTAITLAGSGLVTTSTLDWTTSASSKSAAAFPSPAVSR